MPEPTEKFIGQHESLHTQVNGLDKISSQMAKNPEVQEQAHLLPYGFELSSSHNIEPAVGRWQAYNVRGAIPSFDEDFFPAAEARRMQDQAERAYTAAQELVGNAIIEGKLPEYLWDRLDYLNKINVVGDPNKMICGYSSDVDAAGVYFGQKFVIELSLNGVDDDRATELAVHETLHALSGVDFVIELGNLEERRTGLSVHGIKVTGVKRPISTINHWLDEAMTDKLTMRVAGELSERVDAKNGKPRFYAPELKTLDALQRKTLFPFEARLEDLYFQDMTYLETLHQEAMLFDEAFGRDCLLRLTQFEDDERTMTYIQEEFLAAA